MIKAIETVYNGYRFRSRLEARWAVYFDACNVKWEYEPEGYDLGEAGWYLPDFYLPDLDVWIEIKPRNGDREEVEKKLIAMVEGGIAQPESAWGLFGDPLDHYWLLPVFRPEASSSDKRPAGWEREWGESTAVCLKLDATQLRQDGAIMTFVSSTLSLSGVETLSLDTEMTFVAKDIIDDYAEKVAARSARFEHGERVQKCLSKK